MSIRMNSLLPWFALTLTFIFPFQVFAESRHALVIGNNDYQNARKLVNPINDASVIASSLKSAGFTVAITTDANLKDMKGAVREFIQSLPEKGIALVFFAGHGVEVKGQNYLIPVDATMAEEYEVPDETVSMNSILRGLEQAKTSLNILVLDCCRDDPYSRSWRGGRWVVHAHRYAAGNVHRLFHDSGKNGRRR